MKNNTEVYSLINKQSNPFTIISNSDIHFLIDLKKSLMDYKEKFLKMATPQDGNVWTTELSDRCSLMSDNIANLLNLRSKMENEEIKTILFLAIKKNMNQELTKIKHSLDITSKASASITGLTERWALVLEHLVVLFNLYNKMENNRDCKYLILVINEALLRESKGIKYTLNTLNKTRQLIKNSNFSNLCYYLEKELEKLQEKFFQWLKIPINSN